MSKKKRIEKLKKDICKAAGHNFSADTLQCIRCNESSFRIFLDGKELTRGTDYTEREGGSFFIHPSAERKGWEASRKRDAQISQITITNGINVMAQFLLTNYESVIWSPIGERYGTVSYKI